MWSDVAVFLAATAVAYPVLESIATKVVLQIGRSDKVPFRPIIALILYSYIGALIVAAVVSIVKPPTEVGLVNLATISSVPIAAIVFLASPKILNQPVPIVRRIAVSLCAIANIHLACIISLALYSLVHVWLNLPIY